MSDHNTESFNSRHATNVSDVFIESVKAYSSLTNDILQLIQKIPTSNSGQIAESCSDIETQKKDLKTLDDQIIEILSIAGDELSHNDLVYDYRTALAQASNASNELYQHLLTKKLDIQIDSLRDLIQAS